MAKKEVEPGSLADDYNTLKETSETRIKEEVARYEDFLDKLAELLACKKEEPIILAEISGLIAKENKKVTVVKPDHSKLCRILARFGL